MFQLRPERRRNRVTECGNVLPHVLGRQAAGNHRGDRGMAQRELQRRRRERHAMARAHRLDARHLRHGPTPHTSTQWRIAFSISRTTIPTCRIGPNNLLIVFSLLAPPVPGKLSTPPSLAARVPSSHVDGLLYRGEQGRSNRYRQRVPENCGGTPLLAYSGARLEPNGAGKRHPHFAELTMPA